MELKGKRIAILGAGVSGVQSALFLKKKGADVFLSEISQGSRAAALQAECERAGIASEFGRHSLDRIADSELVVISPGIAPSTEVYRYLAGRKSKIWSEIELAFHFAPCEIVAVTGTNGKTTVTTLIREVLERGGRNAVSCGNIGNPFIGEVESLSKNAVAVVETSSFQLLHTEHFRPRAAVLLNVTDNHLDWHKDFQEYRAAKRRIFQNQRGGDIAVVNGADPNAKACVRGTASEARYFSGEDHPDMNFAAVLKVAEMYGIPRGAALEVLNTFKGLRHRFEDLGSAGGVRFINDSKSTTIASLAWALERVPSNTVLIAGGRPKGGDFADLRKRAAEKVKAIVAIGEAKALIARALDSLVPVIPASTLQEAFDRGVSCARPGETVLFSPACASFDMFLNYEDRGDRFCALVRGLFQ